MRRSPLHTLRYKFYRHHKSYQKTVNRPNLESRKNQTIECIGTVIANSITSAGTPVFCIENVKDYHTNEHLCDHIWIRMNKTIKKQLSWIGMRRPIKVKGHVVEYKPNKYGIKPHHITYIRQTFTTPYEKHDTTPHHLIKDITSTSKYYRCIEDIIQSDHTQKRY